MSAESPSAQSDDVRGAREPDDFATLDPYWEALLTQDVAPEIWAQSHPECQSVLAELRLIKALREAARTLSDDSSVAEPCADADSDAFCALPTEVLPAGTLVDRYRVIRCLGWGGMGEVYLATHEVMGNQVAVKLVRSDRVQNPGAISRFRNEIRTLARLRPHAHIAAAFDAGEWRCRPYLVVEYVPGTNLEDYVKERGPLPVDEACVFMRQAASGLAYIHANGFIHRDLKPSNLMVTVDRQVKILDLGLSGLAEREQLASSAQLTPAGVLLGTLDYLSPEQAADPRQADERSDLYSLGCTFYHLITGRPPFAESSGLLKLAAHARDAVPPMGKSRRDLPPRLVDVVERLLAKRPQDRFQSTEQFVAALDHYNACEQLSGLVALTPNDVVAEDDQRTGGLEKDNLRRGIDSQTVALHRRTWFRAVLGGGVGAAAIVLALWIDRARNPRPMREKEWVIPDVGIEMVRIPAGGFVMGSPESDPDADDCEKPAHPVTISRPFYLGVCEVTQKQYERIMGTNPSYHAPGQDGYSDLKANTKQTFPDTDNLPVEAISWTDAVAFCQKLSDLPSERHAKRRYRLPTEAEWEYACRAGTTTRYYFGDSAIDGKVYANLPNDQRGTPLLVGSLLPNAFGLKDMHGNVREWCQDRWSERYPTGPQIDRLVPASDSKHVVRGGCYHFRAENGRSASRFGIPDHPARNIGFRVAMTPP
jgi:eukaryotic-like serine/threonine-protein kinase